MLVVTRFRVPEADSVSFAEGLARALEVLGRQKGFVEGHLGRNVDEPELWLLQTRWADVGSYRRALSAYDVKMHAWALLGSALDEPSAYEIVDPATGDTNRPVPRETGWR